MRRAALIGLAVSALAAAGAAQAQPSPSRETVASKSVSEVVVTGHRKVKPSASFSQAVSGFVASRAQPSPLGVLSRWMSPVCPTVVGLNPAFTDFVVKEIKGVAEQMGAPRGKCLRSNVRIVFTAQPQQLMDFVREKHPEMLGYHFAPQEKALAAFQEPIDAWHVTATREETGGGHVDDPYNQNDPTVASGGHYFVSGSPSRLKSPTSSDFVFALVVVDFARVGKQPIGQVAEQIAVLVLTNPKRPKSCSPLPSVLDALDPACPASASVADLTPYDEAFLKALYSSDPQERLALQRGEIERSIAARTVEPRKASPAAPPP
jgi:hypothetical protein